MQDTVFHKIIRGELPSVKVREDDKFLAILDLFPNCKGMTLVLPKQYYASDILAMPDTALQDFILAAKQVSEILKQGLGVQRVGMIFEGLEINYAHIKLYPLHGLSTDREPVTAGEQREFFDTYPGYMTTRPGPQKSQEELQAIADEILSTQ